MSKGSKILEIGGGESRVINALSNDYEFWNLDMLEGAGYGPTNIDHKENFVHIKNNIGDFSAKLPDMFFDLVFSISVIEHFSQDEEDLSRIFDDMRRVTKPNGCWVHCVDSIIHSNHIRIHPMVPKLNNEVGDYDLQQIRSKILSDNDLWGLPTYAYYSRWFLKTRKMKESLGNPFSLNLIFHNL
jgi:ubiquinone/menaquinone biosynthesis C-methylase UbiE